MAKSVIMHPANVMIPMTVVTRIIKGGTMYA
jgi:hypothetical protein